MTRTRYQMWAVLIAAPLDFVPRWDRESLVASGDGACNA
jgi:hypothetical protein